MAAELRDDSRAAQVRRSLLELVFFDIALAIDSYISARAVTVARHQDAIRELSTPVLRVRDGILLLPLVGALDSARAEQVIDAVLLRVSAEHARVVLIDVAGVAVVDSQVAGCLVSLATMASLLGARTILTGIAAEITRTVVRLGVDASRMDTRASLDEGLALAFQLEGLSITDKPDQTQGGTDAAVEKRPT